ncbi:MAG: GntR family transcriptional regulator [Rikenellaceae bacterium]|jgi:DNA-binding GntR family transcriptional regulator|nr:GntR family transcriptional regulator [Rikenellaceae bacterium]
MDQLPRYRYIYELLRYAITEGKYAPGDLLPSENDLCAAHGVTRPTVRKALDMLASEGFISRQQGKGSIVKGMPTGIGILSLLSTTTAMDGTSLETKIVAGPELRQWDEAFTYPLSEEEKKRGCIYFERLRILDGEPVILDITMLPNIGIPRFTDNDLNNASLFDLLRRKYQITVTGGTQQLLAISADKHLHAHLRVRQGYPILQLTRRIDTSKEGFHIYSRILCLTNKYVLSGTF